MKQERKYTPARFIPTCVGHTPLAFYCQRGKTVHPHIRGAYPFPLGVAGFDFGSSPHPWGIRLIKQSFQPRNGSSPHTWGIHQGATAQRMCVRFIPTYVGHTAPQVLGQGRLHGSSPHTWGILRQVADLSADSRFIPTYVGHTLLACSFAIPVNGSSPHTWGIQNSPPSRAN